MCRVYSVNQIDIKNTIMSGFSLILTTQFICINIVLISYVFIKRFQNVNCYVFRFARSVVIWFLKNFRPCIRNYMSTYPSNVSPSSQLATSYMLRQPSSLLSSVCSFHFFCILYIPLVHCKHSVLPLFPNSVSSLIWIIHKNLQFSWLDSTHSFQLSACEPRSHSHT